MDGGRSEADLRAKVERAKNYPAKLQRDLDEQMRLMHEARTRQDAAFDEITSAEDAAWNEASTQDLRMSQQLVNTADRLRNLCLDCLNATQEATNVRKIRDDAKGMLAEAETEYAAHG